MSEFEEPFVTASPDRHDTHQPAVEKRKPVQWEEGSLVDLARQHQKVNREHPARLDGGTETVLRPVPRPAGGTSTDDLARDEQRAELFLAAQAARLFRYQVMAFAVAHPLDRTPAVEAGRTGALYAVRHMRRALHLFDMRKTRPDDAVADAFVNCLELIGELDALENGRHEHTETLSKLLGELQRRTGYLPPGTKAARRAVMDKHGRSEAEANALVITAPLRHAASILELALADFQLSRDKRPERDLDADKGPVHFGPAARRAVAMVQRAVRSTMDRSVHVDSHAAGIRAAVAEYFATAQRFVNWGLHSTHANDSITNGAVESVISASEPLAHWARHATLSRPREVTAGGENAGDLQRLEKDAEAHFAAVFQAQHTALMQLATQDKAELQPHWSESLFVTIAQIGLAAVIGGPAGAIGALAGAAIPALEHDGKETRGSVARRGGASNAAEAAVGAAIGALLATPSGSSTEDKARKRFFERQAVAVIDLHTQAKKRFRALHLEDARRSAEPRVAFNHLIATLTTSAGAVVAAQKQRAVQDWMVFRAHATHGTDAKSHGVDMGGVGSDDPAMKPLLPATAATGVLAIDVDIDDAPSVTHATLGTTRKDDVAHMIGIRVSDVRCPMQFRLAAKSTTIVPGVVVVSRNEAGVLWLRAADDDARRHLVTRHGGDPSIDADVLRAAHAVIESLANHRLTMLEAVRP